MDQARCRSAMRISEMPLRRSLLLVLIAATLLALPPPAVLGGGPPAWLPRYDITMDLDVPNHVARLQMKAAWTNRHRTPAHELVFNAHSRYIVPANEVGFEAKILEILRMTPSDTLGVNTPALEVNKVTLDGKTPLDLAFTYEGDTKTALVVALPFAVGEGQSVTVSLDITMHLPPKQGRWGQWEGVTYLSNWLPVFAVYDDVVLAPAGPEERTTNIKNWQPTPFIPWHQPFFNEACIYHVRVTLPCNEVVASSGSVVRTTELKDGKKEIEIV